MRQYSLWLILVICLASGAALAWRREPFFVMFPARARDLPRLALNAATGLLGLLVAVEAVRGMMSLPLEAFSTLGWSALAAAVAAAIACRLRRGASCPATSLYGLGLIAVGMVWAQRGYAPGRYFVWGGLCDLAGFVLVAALVAWVALRISVFARPRAGGEPQQVSPGWFSLAQASIAAITASLAVWIALDFSFDTMGTDTAVLGLSGRAAGCAAALMLLGATILMAGQTRGAVRRAWQYAALAAGLLLTVSFSWSRIDASAASDVAAVWLERSRYLLLSTAMMTVMTRFGLARVLPSGSDWIERGRRAWPVFGAVALLLLLLVLVQRAALSAA